MNMRKLNKLLTSIEKTYNGLSNEDKIRCSKNEEGYYCIFNLITDEEDKMIDELGLVREDGSVDPILDSTLIDLGRISDKLSDERFEDKKSKMRRHSKK